MSTIRKLNYRDIDDVTNLHATQGWSAPSVTAWKHIFEANPAVDPVKHCLGWALEHNDQVVGYLLNIRQLYTLRGETIEAAAAASLLVAPEHGVHSLKLLNRFRQQEDTDVFLTNTAAPVTSDLLRFLKFRPLPQEGYKTNLFWILRSRPFLNSAIRKRYQRTKFSSPASYVGAPALDIALFLRRIFGKSRVPRSSEKRRQKVRFGEIELNSKFDSFWELTSQANMRMMAVRDTNTLRWHFKDFRDPKCRLLGAMKDDCLVGYAIIIRRDNKELGLSRAKIADMVVANEDPGIASGLFKMAMTYARNDGAAMLEIEGLPNSIRGPLHTASPLTISHEKNPFWFWSPNKSILETLSEVDTWYAGLYDGDGSL